MRVIFMGAARFSCPSLKALDTEEVAAVVTRPDRRRGRNLKRAAGPVKLLALERDYPVMSPEDVNCDEVLSRLRDLAPDLIVVVAYGRILKKPLLDVPAKGCINVHASLLPEYRGAAPVQRAIMDGRRRTGVTTMYMAPRMDAGDIIYQEETAVHEGETAGELLDRLAGIGGDLLRKTVQAVKNDAAPRIRQDESAATYAPRLTKEEGALTWALPAREIYNRVRGLSPWPGAYTWIDGKRVIILKVLPLRVNEDSGPQGVVADVDSNGPAIRTGTDSQGNNAVRLIRVKPAGKRDMSGADFFRGINLEQGDRIET
jgi:methionyl-tRNA formyltransferase